MAAAPPGGGMRKEDKGVHMAGEIRITEVTDQIKLESPIPLLGVEGFDFTWEVNEHAFLAVEGYVNGREQATGLHGGKVRLLAGENTTLFYGHLTKIRIDHVGGTAKIHLEAKSGSYKLDQALGSESFQDGDETYAKIVQAVAGRAGGRVICTEGKDREIGKPFIRYGETAWEFCGRLASHLGTCVIPDIVTGEPAFWFGIRKGGRIPAFSEEEYTVEMYRETAEGKSGTAYEVESREFYKLGDRTVFRGAEMTIYGARAEFKDGELIYHYLLRESYAVSPIYLNRFSGLGLRGTVVEARQEQVRVALDIDGGNPTGEYFYEWYPETGNALYAMPETGAHIILYFGGRDEREGYVMHCLPQDVESGWDYRNRNLATKEGNTARLYEGSVDFSNNRKHSLSMEDGTVGIESTGKVTVSAKSGVKIYASRIFISTPDELDICQG